MVIEQTPLEGRLRASQWQAAIEEFPGQLPPELKSIYGADPAYIKERLTLVHRVVEQFQERFGDVPVRLFRAPGRLNLRGMHVDTHGGYLNLMTHGREVIVCGAGRDDDGICVTNVASEFDDIDTRLSDIPGVGALPRDWPEMVSSSDVETARQTAPGHWKWYVLGSVLSLAYATGFDRVGGVNMTVGADLPRGSGLSASAALCIAIYIAAAGVHGIELNPSGIIEGVQRAEWYTGARTGTSDQGAMVLARRDTMVSGVLYPHDLDIGETRPVNFPRELSVIVADSCAKRSLSGAQRTAYSTNRFAYAIALEVIRQELAAGGMRHGSVASVDRLARLTPALFEGTDGRRALYELAASLPEEISVEQLGLVYDLPYLEATYDFYFGSAPPEERPEIIKLRGPVFFGIAESERARVFPTLLEGEEVEKAGELMSIGHNGDRVVRADGSPYTFDVGDTALGLYIKSGRQIYAYPGVYGASIPALDALVDTALAAGALGASLTGGGMGGVIMALCRNEDASRVADALRRVLGMKGYAGLLGRDQPMPESEAAAAVLENRTVAAASELRFGDGS